MALMQPGNFNVPFVDANSTPLRLPTSVVCGELETNIGSPENSAYNLYYIQPLLGWTNGSDICSSGFGQRTNLTGVSVVTADSGYSYTDVYGAATAFSRTKIFATRVDFTISAPEANMSGRVYIGSLPYASFEGSTVTALLDNATTQVDLKKSSSWSLKSAITDRGRIHDEPSALSLASLRDEWVSYCIISRSAVQNITTGVASVYQVLSKFYSNQVWLPAVSTPALNQIAVRAHDSTKPLNKSEQEFANRAQQDVANPIPTAIKTVLTAASKIANGLSAIPVLSPFTGVASMVLSAAAGVLEDPLSKLPDYTKQLADVDFYINITRTWPKGPEEYEDVVQRLVESLLVARRDLASLVEEVKSIRLAAASCERRVIKNRDRDLLVYYLPSGEELDCNLKRRFRDNSIDSKLKKLR